jgi:hypothetical protein
MQMMPKSKITAEELISIIVSDSNPYAQLWAAAIALGLASDWNGIVSLPSGMSRQALNKRVARARKEMGISQSEEGKKKARAAKQATKERWKKIDQFKPAHQ